MTVQDFNPDLPDFADHSFVRAFLGAWNRWRGDALLPTRAQVKSGDIPGLMRGVMLLDAVAPETMIFRYAGSLYQDIYKFDFTGLNYLDITDPSFRHVRAKRLWGVVSQPAAAVWMSAGADGVDFVGVSVPILADDPTHPRKIVQALFPLKDLQGVSHKEWQRKREHVPFSEHFRYIDIGADKPDTSVES